MTTVQQAPEGERLARIEAVVESLVREVSDTKQDIRELRSVVNRNMVVTLGVIITMWVTLIIALLLK